MDQTQEQELKSSRSIGPEDIKAGDYVTIAHTTYELVPDECGSFQRELEPRRITIMSWEAGKPLKVVDVCLPFVLAKDPKGTHVTIDLRRHQLARLDDAFGKKAYKAIRGKAGKESD